MIELKLASSGRPPQSAFLASSVIGGIAVFRLSLPAPKGEDRDRLAATDELSSANRLRLAANSG